MKNHNFFILVVFLLMGKLVAQPTILNIPRVLTPNGMFDKVYDRFGNQYDLADVSLQSARPFGGSYTIATVPTESCAAGYFELYFAPSSIFTTGSFSAQAQAVICEVFNSLSGFITSPLTLTNNRVKIYCENVSVAGQLASASSNYCFAYLPSSLAPGYVDGLVHQTIVSGYDAYASLPVTFFNAYPSGNFYHGFVRVNPSANWNFSMNTATINVTEYDFYTVMLHEAIHTLGFESLIDYTGLSKFGGLANNYYSRYDKFLYDYNNYPMLTSSSPTSCPNTNPSFNYAAINPFVSLASAGCVSTGINVNVTTCSVAAQYSSTNVTSKIYTPDCFEPGSSLSHFEDMCSYGTFTTTCTPTPTNPGYNDLYYLMSNFSFTGSTSCYVKRFMREEEKAVLCDLGYTTNTLIVSSASLATHSYTNNCTPTETIVGNHDGYLNGVFSYTTNTNTLTLSATSILSNDYPASGLNISCLEVVYSNGTATLSGSTITVSSTQGIGLVLLKYYPQNGAGQVGNATYIFTYFISGGCAPTNSCNLVQNNGFENLAGGAPCGYIDYSTGVTPTISCWEPYLGNNGRLYNANCTSFGGTYDLGNSTNNIFPPISSFNGTVVNTSVVGLTAVNSNSFVSSSLKNILSGPLTPGLTYQLSFWAINPVSVAMGNTVNPNYAPTVLTVASYTSAAFTATSSFPTGLNVLTQFTINAGNTWSQLTNTFVYSNTLTPGQVIVIGINSVVATSVPSPTLMELFIDDITLVPLPNTSFTLPQTNICSYKSYTNLAQYASSVTVGTFSGTGVTYSGGQYHFNTAGTLTPGSYPIAFSYTNGGCSNTIWQNVVISTGTNCCSSVSGVFSGSSLTTSLTGVNTFTGNVIVPTGATATLTAGDFRIAAGASITVDNGGYLKIVGSHLHACSEEMWQGIVINDGGRLLCDAASTGSTNLIEDAVNAIDISGQTTTTLNPILESRFTTFNKNYIDIKIDNYQRTNTSYSTAFSINSCVFTCRDYSFTSSQWPQATISDLRSAGISTTGLASPYLLQSVSTATLKSPYAGKTSSIAIQMSSVGVTSGSNFYGVNFGSIASPTLFNLFDSHQTFIHASNSNLTLGNNVFQNTIFDGTNTGITGDGSAVYDAVTTALSNKLEMSSSSVDVGNRFWNCHRGVQGKNVYNFNIEKAIFRSTQTSTNTAFGPGYIAIDMRTSRIAYLILRTEFTNVNTGINVTLLPGTTTLIPTCSVCPQPAGIYATHLAVNENTLSYGTGGGNYMSNAIEVSSPNQSSLSIATATWISPTIIGINIEANHIDRAYRGVNVSGMVGWRTMIKDNFISLEDDASAAAAQFGVRVSNGIATATNAGRCSIIGNDVRSVASNSLTDTKLSLIYSGDNVGPGLGIGLSSPSVVCNSVKNGYNGFEFSGPNTGTAWYGNQMQNLARGMLLNYGVISAQGSPTFAMNNRWNGTWTSGTNFGIYTEQSTASLSPLFVATSGSTIYPPNLSGNPNPLSYAIFSPSVTSGGASYDCYAPTNRSSSPLLPDILDYPNDESYFIAINTMYRFLHLNDSLKISNITLKNFYDGLAGSSVESFVQIEEALIENDFSTANSVISAISPTNGVETYYVDYYTLYINYASHSFEHSNSSDSSSLWSIASQCPALFGGSIYQARALYNAVYRQTGAWGGCPGNGARLAQVNPVTNSINEWLLKLYPNPSKSSIYLESTYENAVLVVKIYDLSGRIMLVKRIQQNGFIANLDLNLMNGAYFVNVTNENNIQVTKKLLIAK